MFLLGNGSGDEKQSEQSEQRSGEREALRPVRTQPPECAAARQNSATGLRRLRAPSLVWYAGRASPSATGTLRVPRAPAPHSLRSLGSTGLITHPRFAARAGP